MEYMTNTQLFERYEQLRSEMDEVQAEVDKRKFSWQHLAHYGMIAQAVRVYRDKYKTDLREAHEAVRAFIKEVKE